MEQSEKVHENNLRRMAERQALALSKSSRRDPHAIDHDRWMILDAVTKRVVAGAGPTGRPAMSLAEVEAYLKGER